MYLLKPNLSTLPHEDAVAAILTASDDAQRAAWAARSRARHVPRGKVLRRCVLCGGEFGGRDFRGECPRADDRSKRHREG